MAKSETCSESQMMILFRIIISNVIILSFLSCLEDVSIPPNRNEEHIKTNILFIFADDWGWGDISALGHPYVMTPNIDLLVAEGTDFQRYTVASGVCSPSRTAVITGHFQLDTILMGILHGCRKTQGETWPDCDIAQDVYEENDLKEKNTFIVVI